MHQKSSASIWLISLLPGLSAFQQIKIVSCYQKVLFSCFKSTKTAQLPQVHAAGHAFCMSANASPPEASLKYTFMRSNCRSFEPCAAMRYIHLSIISLCRASFMVTQLDISRSYSKQRLRIPGTCPQGPRHAHRKRPAECSGRHQPLLRLRTAPCLKTRQQDGPPPRTLLRFDFRTGLPECAQSPSWLQSFSTRRPAVPRATECSSRRNVRQYGQRFYTSDGEPVATETCQIGQSNRQMLH